MPELCDTFTGQQIRHIDLPRISASLHTESDNFIRKVKQLKMSLFKDKLCIVVAYACDCIADDDENHDGDKGSIEISDSDINYIHHMMRYTLKR